jgi:hypothetical protein
MRATENFKQIKPNTATGVMDTKEKPWVFEICGW